MVVEPESKPLFESEEDYQKFIERHKSHDAKYAKLKDYAGKAYLGILKHFISCPPISRM